MGADREFSDPAAPAQDLGQDPGTHRPEPEPVLIAVVAASEPLQLLPPLRSLGEEIRVEIQLFGSEEIGALAGGRPD